MTITLIVVLHLRDLLTLTDKFYKDLALVHFDNNLIAYEWTFLGPWLFYIDLFCFTLNFNSNTTDNLDLWPCPLYFVSVCRDVALIFLRFLNLHDLKPWLFYHSLYWPLFPQHVVTLTHELLNAETRIADYYRFLCPFINPTQHLLSTSLFTLTFVDLSIPWPWQRAREFPWPICRSAASLTFNYLP